MDLGVLYILMSIDHLLNFWNHSTGTFKWIHLFTSENILNVYHKQSPLLNEMKNKINVRSPLVQRASLPFRVVTGKLELIHTELALSFSFLLLSPPSSPITSTLSIISTFLLLVLPVPWTFGLFASDVWQKPPTLGGYNWKPGLLET